MAEENKVEESANPEAEGEEQAPKKKANIVLIAAIVLSVVVIALGGIFVLKSGSDKKEVKEEVAQVLPSIFYPLPEMIVSLSGNSSNIRYLKLVLSLEIATPEDQVIIEGKLPKIIDEYQTYLRQLRLEDLRGSVGTYRLKDSLLLRANQVVQPIEVKDVLIKEMLVQ